MGNVPATPLSTGVDMAGRIIDAQAGHHCAAGETTLNWSKGYTCRGTWSSSTTYSVLDVVTSGGSSYFARAASPGQVTCGQPGLVGAARGPRSRRPAGRDRGAGSRWSAGRGRGAGSRWSARSRRAPGAVGVSGYNVVTEFFTVNTAPSCSLTSSARPAGPRRRGSTIRERVPRPRQRAMGLRFRVEHR